MRYVVAALYCLIIASLLQAQNPGTSNKTAPPSNGNAQNGRKIYASYGCYQCHGYEGQGGVGPRLALTAMSFAGFSKYVRQPTAEMPPYTAKVVSDKELTDIYSFLQSIAPPPPAKNIPLLNNN